jgi:flagellar basal body-associated protein FliL
MSDPKPPTAAKPTKSRTPLILGLVGLLAAGGGAYYWMNGRGVATAAHAEAIERGVVAFEPFVVNLADANVSRFLRVTMQLVLSSEREAAKLEESKVALLQARSAILELLTMQKSEALVTADGKAALRAAIVERVSHTIAPFEVVDVLFSDFVVQF